MPATDPTTLTLEGALEIGRIAELWPALRQRSAGISRIDLGAVTAIDSAGVALVRCLQQRAQTAGGSVAIVNPPPRFAQIGLAHRVEAGGD